MEGPTGEGSTAAGLGPTSVCVCVCVFACEGPEVQCCEALLLRAASWLQCELRAAEAAYMSPQGYPSG